MTAYDNEIEPAETEPKHSKLKSVLQKLIIHAAVLTYLVLATLQYNKSRESFSNDT